MTTPKRLLRAMEPEGVWAESRPGASSTGRRRRHHRGSLGQGPSTRGLRHRAGGHRLRRNGSDSARRCAPRPRAAGHRRLRGVPQDAGHVRRAHRVPHRPLRRDRPRGRPGAGRRRLRREAVRLPGAGGAHPRRHPPPGPGETAGRDRHPSSGRWPGDRPQSPAGGARWRGGRAHAQGVRPRGADGAGPRCGLRAAPDHGRGLGASLVRANQDAGRPRGVGPQEVRGPGLDRNGSGRGIPPSPIGMIRRLLAGYLSITLFILIVLEIPLGISFARLQRNRLVADVQHDAATIALFAEPRVEARDTAGLQQVADSYRARTKGRVVILDETGVLRADSDATGRPVPARDFSSRPEIKRALAGTEAHGFRHSNLLGHDLLYVAVPMNSGGAVRGGVRITDPASVLAHTILPIWATVYRFALLILAVVIAVSFRLARSLLAPLHDLEGAAARLGEGDLKARARVPEGPRELTVLAREFNATASKLARLADATA